MEKETKPAGWELSGHLICNGPSNPSFNRPLFSPGCVIYILYIYRCTVQVSAWVCRADSQVFFLTCSHSNMTPGADQSCCLRGSGWGTALAMPLAFPKRLLYLNWCFCFFCMLPCHKTIAVCGNSPSTRHIKGDMPIKRILLSRTDEAKLYWP